MRRLWLIAAVMSLVMALPAEARETRKIHAYLGAGPSVPVKTGRGTWILGFHGQGGLGFMASDRFEIIAAVAFHSFGYDWLGTSSSGATLEISMVGVDLKLSLGREGRKITPFLIGGAGMGIVRSGDPRASLNLGAGLDFKKSPRATPFLKVGFVGVNAPGSSISYIPFTLGLKF